MWSTLNLISKSFWRGIIGPIFTYLIPLALLLFVGIIIGPQHIVPSVFLIPSLCVLLVFMPQSVFEFKNSTILKRIGATPIKTASLFLIIGLFNCFLIISSTILMLGLSFAVFNNSLNNLANINPPNMPVSPDYLYMFLHGNWGEFIYAFVLMLLLGVFFGLFIASISRSTIFIQAVGIAMLLFVFFIGPVAFPIARVAQVDIIRWFGYIIPFKYPIGLAIEGFTSSIGQTMVNMNASSIFDINSNYDVFATMVNSTANHFKVFDQAGKIVNLIMPWVFIAIFAYLTIITFSWSNKAGKLFNWNVPINTIKHWFKATKLQFTTNNPNTNKTDAKTSCNEHVIEISQICKTFKTKKDVIVANDHVSFNITRHRHLGLLGANGAGKTTLIEMLVGINNPDSGSFNYNFDHSLNFKQHIGIQFQDSNYPFGMRCKDVILYFLRVYKIDMDKQELRKLLDTFGITKFYKWNCSSLSGGQSQRLNLILSILHKPQLLILDELSTGLDVKIKTEIREFIKQYANTHGMTIVVISHDMNEVTYLCEDIVMMKDGKVIDVTTTEQLLAQHNDLETYVNAYL